MEIRSSSGSRPEKTVDLESHNGSWIQSKCPSVFGEIGQQILRVEETDHGHSSGNIDRIDIVAINEWTEMSMTHLG